jgi:RNA polymerase sigma-70 factor (ECF subfamily)
MAAEARSFRPPHASTGANADGAAAASLARLTPLRELQLIEQFRVGGPESHRAMTELLAAYQRRIYSVCFRMVKRPEDAADLTQDVLLKLVENLSTYDGRAKLSTWVIRVAMNACLSHLRKKNVRKEQSLQNGRRIDGDRAGAGGLGGVAGQGLSAREPSPAEGVEQQRQRALVLRALESLDDDTRAILVLRDVQDMDYQQLAEVLEVPLGTVKSRLFRARAALREAIESLGGP